MQMDEELAQITIGYLKVMAFGALPYLLMITFRCLNDGIANKTGNGHCLYLFAAQCAAQLYLYLRCIRYTGIRCDWLWHCHYDFELGRFYSDYNLLLQRAESA